MKQLLIGLSILLILFGCAQEKPEKSPNVILILADDQGWGDLSLHGNPYVSTPHIDQIAKDGIQLTNFFVQPVCSPTRAEILTGRYHVRGGVYSTSAGGERLDIDEYTIGQAFQSSGYKTAAFGKWHSGSQHPYHPNSRGFDHYYGFTSGHWGDYFDPMLEENGNITHGQGFITDDLTTKAIDYLKKNKDESMFVYLPYNVPHSPMQVPDKYWNQHATQEINSLPRQNIMHTRAAYAMIENMDYNVGRLTQAIEELGIEEKTIVIYLTDNGPNGHRWNGGLKGTKGTTDEGGVKSPMFIKWKDHIKAGSIDDVVSGAIDLLPTLIDLCHLDSALPKALDGQSIAANIMGFEAHQNDRRYFNYWKDKLSVRTEQYRLDHQNRLYDMIIDPNQVYDISTERQEAYQELMAAKKEWSENVLSELNTEEKRPLTVGYHADQIDHLPIRDATGTQNIIRSNRYPNDSYFTNWTSTEDTISWDIDVQQSGVYSALIYYTAAENSISTAIQLSTESSKTTGVIKDSAVQAALGAAEDRIPRQESYTQDWITMELEGIQLTKGKSKLYLTAQNITGDQVMDVRLLLIQKMD